MLAILTLLIPQSAQAKEIQLGNLKLNLPDEISVTGYESGTESRNCTLKFTVKADAGTTIPLRGGVSIQLRDSLYASIDSFYNQATVEGLTELVLQSAFNCYASSGTLKPPYTFSVIALNLPGVSPFLDPVPVRLNFTAPTPKATPTPTLIVTATPKMSDSEAVTLSQNAELKARLTQLESRFKTIQAALLKANQKLTKICSAKPKPKGC